jgi:hypothetical protein
MLWQTLALLTPFAVNAQAEQLTHMTVHQQEVDHHHHDDASLHLSSDGDASFHAHVDHGFQSAGLYTPSVAVAFVPHSSAVPAARFNEPQAVFLDGLLRPPRHHA